MIGKKQGCGAKSRNWAICKEPEIRWKLRSRSWSY